MTYDLFGNFKRSFTFKEGEDEDTKSWVYYKAIFNLTGITSSAKMLVVGVISMGLIRILSLGIYS